MGWGGNGSQMSCKQRWGCAELGQSKFSQGLNSTCQGNLIRVIRGEGRALIFFLKDAPVLRAAMFLQEKLCVEASDAPRRYSVLQSSDTPVPILPNKLLHCLFPPPLKNGSRIAC